MKFSKKILKRGEKLMMASVKDDWYNESIADKHLTDLYTLWEEKVSRDDRENEFNKFVVAILTNLIAQKKIKTRLGRSEKAKALIIQSIYTPSKLERTKFSQKLADNILEGLIDYYDSNDEKSLELLAEKLFYDNSQVILEFVDEIEYDDQFNPIDQTREIRILSLEESV